MAMTEACALARTLNIAGELYAALSKGEELSGAVTLLDSISAAFSHCQNEQKPLAKCMRQLKKQIKRGNAEFYRTVKSNFSRMFPVLPYDFEKAAKHIPALIYGNDKICERLQNNEQNKARSMADAMKSYPRFLFGEFEALSDEQFYELVFGYYPKLYDEPFMDEMRYLFI